MDINNNLELKYLTNNHYRNNIKQEQLKLHSEFDKYKDRIIELTKLLSTKHELNLTLEKGFIEYTNICISYLKDIDLKDLIQEEYVGYEEKKKLTKVEPLDKNINKTIFNYDKNKNILQQFVKIKKTHEQIYLPKKREKKIKSIQ